MPRVIATIWYELVAASQKHHVLWKSEYIVELKIASTKPWQQN